MHELDLRLENSEFGTHPRGRLAGTGMTKFLKSSHRTLETFREKQPFEKEVGRVLAPTTHGTIAEVKPGGSANLKHF